MLATQRYAQVKVTYKNGRYLVFPDAKCKKDNSELFLMACTGDRFHSVRVIDQYKEILENEPKKCSFFATVTSPISHSPYLWLVQSSRRD